MSAGPSTGNSNALIAPIYDKIPLAHLLDFAVQKTYHELYTMADVYVLYRYCAEFHNDVLFIFLI